VCRRLTLVFWLACVAPATAQSPVPSEGYIVFNQMFEAPPVPNSLQCTTALRGPLLDLAFRFNIGYRVTCHLPDFQTTTAIRAFTRVTPHGAEPVLLWETYALPQVPAEMQGTDSLRRKKDLEFWLSGSFSVGEGDYRVEVLLADNMERRSFRRWDVHVARKHKEETISPTIAPGTVSPTVAVHWDGKLSKTGLRLTILLDAATVNPNETRLYVWDRAVLLESLASLLRQTPCKSVRLVAFSLDQQKEIFRQDKFDARAFSDLGDALRQLELGTVSYKALQKGASAALLLDLARKETALKEPSDAVIFIGPSSHFDEQIPKASLATLEKGGMHFYYFEYFVGLQGDFPDAIDHLTRDLHGTVFKIHSAAELGIAIQKMLTEVKPGEVEKKPDSLIPEPSGPFWRPFQQQ